MILIFGIFDENVFISFSQVQNMGSLTFFIFEFVFLQGELLCQVFAAFLKFLLFIKQVLPELVLFLLLYLQPIFLLL